MSTNNLAYGLSLFKGPAPRTLLMSGGMLMPSRDPPLKISSWAEIFPLHCTFSFGHCILP